MALKSIFTKTKLSKTQLCLVAILLAFVLLLVFIWLWYSLELTRIDKQLKPSKPSSILTSNSNMPRPKQQPRYFFITHKTSNNAIGEFFRRS